MASTRLRLISPTPSPIEPERHPVETRALEVRGLCKHYGGIVAVDNLELEVRAGACLALLGPNGAGKSTTLLMLAGVIAPDAGTVTIAGDVDPTRARVRRRVGFVPQTVALYPELSAEENLRLFARVQRVSRREMPDRVEAALRLASLTDRRHQRVKTFSGGMQRRLNVACATMHDPDLLLLDEPTVGVDPHSRAHLFDSIEALRERGVTIVYSTHYMEEAERLCDQVAVIDRGRLLAVGTRESLLREFSSGYRVEVDVLPYSERVPSALARAPERMRFTSTDAGEVATRLAELGGAVSGLNVTRPNLEDVFLELTGRSLRDE